MIWTQDNTSKTLYLPRVRPLFLTRYPCYISADGTTNPRAFDMSVAQAKKIFASIDTAFEKFAKAHFGPARLADGDGASSATAARGVPFAVGGRGSRGRPGGAAAGVGRGVVQ
jgi:hypothetical protein